MDVSKSITYHVTKTGNTLRRLTAKKIRSAGLDITPEESVILNQLWDRGRQSLAELAQWTVKEPSALTRQVDSLVQKGYLKRQQSASDRRGVEVSLTSKGSALEAQFERTGIRQLDKHLVGSLGESPEKLLEILSRIHLAALDELGKN